MPPQGRHWVNSYTKGDGTYVPGHWSNDPRRRRNAAQQGDHSKPRTSSSHPTSGKTGITVAVTLAVAGIGIVAVSLTTGSSAGSASLSGEGNAPTTRSEAPAEVSIAINRSEALLAASGHRIDTSWAFDRNCTANSYGQVRKFFSSHHCKWLFRAAAILMVPRYGAILVAISWVSMHSTAWARKYKKLVDAPGTGNATELTRLSGPYKNVSYSGALYISGMQGADVWNAEVEAVSAMPVNVEAKILSNSRQ